MHSYPQDALSDDWAVFFYSQRSFNFNPFRSELLSSLPVFTPLPPGPPSLHLGLPCFPIKRSNAERGSRKKAWTGGRTGPTPLLWYWHDSGFKTNKRRTCGFRAGSRAFLTTVCKVESHGALPKRVWLAHRSSAGCKVGFLTCSQSRDGEITRIGMDPCQGVESGGG